MLRDLRDPQKLGLKYLAARATGVPIARAVKRKVKDYQNGKYISCDPAEHHSKTPQKTGDLSD